MALERTQSEFSYKSSSGGSSYYFTVIYIDDTNVQVRNMQTPFGLIQDSFSTLPQSVIADMRIATLQVLQIMATSAINGIVEFTAQTSTDITFDSALDDDTYRVVTSLEDFISVRITNKTTAGFTIETGITYTGSIGYDVFI